MLSNIIPYITIGFPTIKDSFKLIERFLKICDYVEAGIPFSDPIADGKTIQYSSEIALKNGASIKHAIEAIKEFGERIFIITYLNPVYNFGFEKFILTAKQYKLKGIILPEVSPELDRVFINKIKTHSLNYIPLITPNTSINRMEEIIKYAGDFIYSVSVLGVTGIRERFAKNLKNFLLELRNRYRGNIMLGFGVSKKTHIDEFRKYVNYFVVGSHIIELIKNGADPIEGIKRLCQNNS